ncbi:MAG: hypothetical protein AAB538_00805, partial [Patescibacteria group bacterium]
MEVMYEAEMLTLDILCDRSKNAVDVGAYTGVYIQELISRSHHVYAYEPLPWLVKTLRHLFLSHPVSVQEVALFNRQGAATLYTPRYTNPAENVDRFVDECSSLTQTFENMCQQYPSRFT